MVLCNSNLNAAFLETDKVFKGWHDNNVFLNDNST